MLALETWLNNLKYLVTNRLTHYNNSFPFNCGYIHSDGSISFDCIGLIKSEINQPDIVYKRNPMGWYVKPGQVIPDTSELGILYLCSEVEWNKFLNMVPGEYLYMEGHGGVYVGDLFGKGSGVNVIECTTGWGVDGVVASWIDPNNGGRYDMKDGTRLGTWEAHGKLSKYVDYSAKKTGWVKEGNDWYYYNDDGSKHKGWLWDKYYKGWFLFGTDGKMLTGWQKVDGRWYYLRKKTKDDKKIKGKMCKGWIKSNGKIYYCYKKAHPEKDIKEGQMMTGTHRIKGKKYTFGPDGALIE